MTPESLLLLEDDALLAEQTGRAFAHHGIRTHHAADLQQAHALLATLPALDAAVLDQNLGSGNGLDLIQPLLARFPHCRVVVLTGYGSIPAAVAATRRGAHTYLTKPASAGEILDALGRDPDDPGDLPDAPPSLQRLEWEHIQRVLDAHGGNISRAADALGIHRRTLQRRLKKRPSPSHFQRDR
ncbi:MAG TPA: response regulator [Alcanivorax sp.]|nr:response regulator [Alcanivorax sp.]